MCPFKIRPCKSSRVHTEASQHWRNGLWGPDRALLWGLPSAYLALSGSPSFPPSDASRHPHHHPQIVAARKVPWGAEAKLPPVGSPCCRVFNTRKYGAWRSWGRCQGEDAARNCSEGGWPHAARTVAGEQGRANDGLAPLWPWACLNTREDSTGCSWSPSSNCTFAQYLSSSGTNRGGRSQEEIAPPCLQRDNSVISPGAWTQARKERGDLPLAQGHLQ